MTNLQKIRIKMSEHRQRINELMTMENRTAEQTAELDTLTRGIQALEVELRAAEALDATEPNGDPDGLTAEEREIRNLEQRSELRNYLSAAARGVGIAEGPEAELNQALELSADQVPLEVLAPPEERADAATSAPATTDRERDPILGRIFARSAAAYLGVRFPRVGVGERAYPVLTDGTTAETKAKGAAKDATAATFEVSTLTPVRLQARYLFRIEDAAVFAGMEAALRRDLSGAMSDALDLAVLTGDGVAPNPSGFFTKLSDPTATSNAAMVGDFVAAVAGQVDGKHAMDAGEIRLLVGADTYELMARIFLVNTAISALNHIRNIGGGVRVSAHVPAVANKKQEALTVRGGGHAVAPVWPSVQLIRDPYTRSNRGEVALTAVMLYNFAIVRDSGFARQAFQLS